MRGSRSRFAANFLGLQRDFLDVLAKKMQGWVGSRFGIAVVFEVLVEAWTLRRKTEQIGVKRTRNGILRFAEFNLASHRNDMNRQSFQYRSLEGSGSRGEGKSSRQVADQFHEAVLYCLMIQNARILKARH
uniref:Uncharacterized protein n=1 Tax=Solanum tuberosum TaxID=4113 RepID=M1DA25_SOLTU